MLWDVNDGKHLYSLDASSPIQVRSTRDNEMFDSLVRNRKYTAF